MLVQIGQQHRRRVDVIHSDVEKALNLVGVQVHGQQALHTHGLQHVGHHLGGDGHTGRTGAAILAGIAEIRDGCSDTTRRRALERIDQDHHLHQIVVGRHAGRLQDEHILASHVFQQLDIDLAVGKPADRR